MNFIWTSEQTVIISLYCINWLVFITDMDCVYCETWTEYLNSTEVNVNLWRVKHHAINVYGVVDILLYTSLSLAVDGGDWSASHPCLFTTGHQMMICWWSSLNLSPQLFHLPSPVFRDVTTHPRRLQLWFFCISLCVIQVTLGEF